jgi:hypothetical protein
MNEIITDFFSTENFKASLENALNSGRPTGTRGKNPRSRTRGHEPWKKKLQPRNWG